MNGINTSDVGKKKTQCRHRDKVLEESRKPAADGGHVATVAAAPLWLLLHV